ncbi:MAG: hypothetical protein RLN62_06310 [Rickettsiales bacterium]
MSRELNFIFTVEKQQTHLAVSIISFFYNVIQIINKQIKCELNIKIHNAGVNLEIVTDSEEYKHKIGLLAKQYGEVLQNKIPMNDLFGGDGDAIMELKKMLDLAIVEMQILGSNDSGGEMTPDEIRQSSNSLLTSLGKVFATS